MHSPTRAGAYIIEPVGGLGNQLFQYALGRRMSLSEDVPLMVDRWWYTATRSRAFALESFASIFSEAAPRRRMPWEQFRLPLAVRTPRLARLAFSDLYAERHEAFDAKAITRPPGTRYLGYFQSWRYFDGFGDDIRAEIRRVKDPSSWFLSELKRNSTGRRVVIHVRHGDYASPQGANTHGVLDEDYYMRALDAVNPHSEAEAVIYSDSPEAAESLRLLVAKRCETRIAENPAAARPIEVLVTMADCEAIICANSTFSWWAAYLGDSPGRTVVVPKQWFADREIERRDRFLPSWNVA